MTEMFSSLYIANRGEIAGRIARTCRRLGVRSVVGYSPADAELPFVSVADEAVALDGAGPGHGYLDRAGQVAAAVDASCAAVHPGYGFLSESAEFAQQVLQAGLIWVGPSPEVMRSMGDKAQARRIARSLGLPVTAGSEVSDQVEQLVLDAAEIGYPVMLKASGGGGGIGIAAAASEPELRRVFEQTRRLAQRAFSSSSVYLEKLVPRARHIEVQILGLSSGQVLILGLRDCSVQRRNQKVIEETPPANLEPEVVVAITAAAEHLATAIGYRGAGTVEFLVESGGHDFYFLEMNPRLQVEHPVTELTYRIDLVEEQLRVAADLEPALDVDDLQPRGVALELRINGEHPVTFMPSPGRIIDWHEPRGPGVRVDAGYAAGNELTPFYDPLLAKLCIWAPDRVAALAQARAALTEFQIAGIDTNISFLAAVLDDPEFAEGRHDTGLVARRGRLANR